VKLILENWRRYLNEGIDPRIQKQIDNMMQFRNFGITIKRTSSKTVEVRYGQLSGKWAKHGMSVPGSKQPTGVVTIEKVKPKVDGECLGGWVVSLSRATDGWGPLLYEVAIEWASQNGGGLMADRDTVSDDAAAVWSKYAARGGDIQVKQMDISHGKEKSGIKRYGPEEDIFLRGDTKPTKKRTISADDIPQLTPDNPEDDCNQNQAIKVGDVDGWMKTPHSKIYKKDTDEVIKALERAKRLIQP